MGHIYVSITAKLTTLVPELIKRANLPADSSLILFEEIKPNMLEKIEDIDKPLEHLLEELMDGDIIVFQRDLPQNNNFRLPYCRDYFRYAQTHEEITPTPLFFKAEI